MKTKILKIKPIYLLCFYFSYSFRLICCLCFSNVQKNLKLPCLSVKSKLVFSALYFYFYTRFLEVAFIILGYRLKTFMLLFHIMSLVIIISSFRFNLSRTFLLNWAACFFCCQIRCFYVLVIWHILFGKL